VEGYTPAGQLFNGFVMFLIVLTVIQVSKHAVMIQRVLSDAKLGSVSVCRMLCADC
jgi:hypothetical protein